MKLNLAIPLVDISGTPVLGTDGKELFLHNLVSNALMAPDGKEETTAPDEKLKRYTLAKRVMASPDNITLDLPEAQLIVNLTGKAYPSPLIVGRVNDEINGT